MGSSFPIPRQILLAKLLRLEILIIWKLSLEGSPQNMGKGLPPWSISPPNPGLKLQVGKSSWIMGPIIQVRLLLYIVGPTPREIFIISYRPGLFAPTGGL